MKVDRLDHLVLTVADIEATLRFYCDVLGMQAERFDATDGTTRQALTFGAQKINLHKAGAEFEPKADVATAGSADLCFLSDVNLEHWQAHLEKLGVSVIEGPVRRTGAQGAILSIYLRDPDGNLLEVANQL